MSTLLTRLYDAAVPPDFARVQAAHPRRYPAVFESAASGGALGRYDILFRADGGSLTLHADGRMTGVGAECAGFLDGLDRWWTRDRDASVATSLPFHGGWCLYLGYELAAQVEPRLRLPPGVGPAAHAVRCPAAAIRDHATGQVWLVAEAGGERLLMELARDLSQPAPAVDTAVAALAFTEDDPDEYLAAVTRALAYIAAGDIYQANLARRWRAPRPAGAGSHGYYQRLRRANPGPFAGMMSVPGLDVLSTSPERLVEVRDGWAQTRPIAGTQARSGDDAPAIAALLASVKDRAEHVMLIDLERNDLGRICDPGTVSVSEYGVVESYAHVHHLVSNVRGRLRPGTTPGQVIRALFPGGTITGCPKVRCMEIIAEIEGAGRGAYTGSFGYLNRDGSADLNILIRTAVLTDTHVEIRAGAGIVADSVPERELEETRAKARGLLRGLEGGA